MKNILWLPVLSALAGIVAFLPNNFYPAIFIFLVPLFIFFVREEKLWRLIAGALLFRLLFSLGTVYFTLEPILWISSLLIFLGLPIFIFLFKKLLRQGSQTSLWKSDFPALIFLPFVWTFFDYLQAQYSLIPDYVTIAGNALGSSPFLGLAGIGGIIALTFFVALINILITALIMQKQRNRFAIALGATIGIILFSGWQISNFELRKNAAVYAALQNSFTIAVISTGDTFTADSFNGLVQELARQKTDFVVFPENIFNRQTSPLIFQNTARGLHTNVLAAYDTFQNGNKYNSSILFDAQGDIVGIHNKNRLTFIGEYWPFGNWQPSLYTWLREKNPEIGTYAIFDQKNADAPGQRNLLSATFGGNAVLFAAPICLEIQYSSDMKAYRAQGARFIVNQSSNRWISAGLGLVHFLYLETSLKKIESVALQLPIISSGVDDIIGVILPDGQTRLLNYQTTNKNYSVFFGTIRY